MVGMLGVMKWYSDKTEILFRSERLLKFLKRVFISVNPGSPNSKHDECTKDYIMYQGWKFCPYCGCKFKSR
jgi:hypothetical protein